MEPIVVEVDARRGRRGPPHRARGRGPRRRGSSSRPATPVWSRSFARRQSRSRRFPSCGRGPTSTTSRSRSCVPRISRRRSSSRSCAASSPTRPRRGRARVRPGADRDRAQLLGQARRASSRCAAPKAGPRPGYRQPAHPCQQAMLREVAEAAEVAPSSLVDGGGRVRCADLRAAARARRPRLRPARVARGRRRASCGRCALTPISSVARSPPTQSSSATLDGWVAKGGAEGLFCAASADGLGIALKVVGRRVSRDPARRWRTCSAVLGLDAPALAHGRGREQPRRARRRACASLVTIASDDR